MASLNPATQQRENGRKEVRAKREKLMSDKQRAFRTNPKNTCS